MGLRPFERIHHQSPFVEELLYFGFFRFACLFFLLFIHRLGDQQLLNRERGVKWLVVVIQIQHARAKDHRHNQGHHGVTISDIIVRRQWEGKKFLLNLVQVEQVFQVIRFAVAVEDRARRASHHLVSLWRERLDGQALAYTVLYHRELVASFLNRDNRMMEALKGERDGILLLWKLKMIVNAIQ